MCVRACVCMPRPNVGGVQVQTGQVKHTLAATCFVASFFAVAVVCWVLGCVLLGVYLCMRGHSPYLAQPEECGDLGWPIATTSPCSG
jgi:hypothetical protein